MKAAPRRTEYRSLAARLRYVPICLQRLGVSRAIATNNDQIHIPMLHQMSCRAVRNHCVRPAMLAQFPRGKFRA